MGKKKKAKKVEASLKEVPVSDSTTQQNAENKTSLLDILAVKISILSVIETQPEAPNNTISRQNSPQQEGIFERKLRRDHEIVITQQLVFICAYSDNANHVLAVCIEETRPGPGLIFRIAANTGKHKKLITAMKKVSEILQNEAKKVDRSSNGDALLKVVVSLNHNRILCRMRSQHANTSKGKNKPTMASKLKEARNSLAQLTDESLDIPGFLDALQGIIGYLDKLETMSKDQAHASESEEIIIAVIREVRTLLLNHEKILLLLQTRCSWPAIETQSLIKKLSKLSYYIVACDGVLRASRRYLEFSSIDITLVGSRQSKKPFSDGCQEFMKSGCSESMLSQVAEHRGGNESVEQVRAKLHENLGLKAKVHAEIQLLLFYEENPQLLRPRILCSTKSACYLCCLLIQTHGQYIVPRTHGKLYGRWKWPERQKGGPKLKNLIPRFTGQLDAKIEECLRRGKIKPEPLDAESVISFSLALTPSVLSFGSRTSNRKSKSCLPKFEQGRKEAEPVNDEDNDDALSTTSTLTVTQADPITFALAGKERIDSLINLPTLPASETELVPTRTATPCLNSPARSSARGSKERYSEAGSARTVTPRPERDGQEPNDERIVRLLERGAVAPHTLDENNCLLRLQVPDLHLQLEYELQHSTGNGEGSVRSSPPPPPPSLPPQTNTTTISSRGVRSNSLPLLLEYLHVADCKESELAQAVNLGGKWEEKTTPEGALFSADGLLLRRGSTILRLRAVFD